MFKRNFAVSFACSALLAVACGHDDSSAESSISAGGTAGDPSGGSAGIGDASGAQTGGTAGTTGADDCEEHDDCPARHACVQNEQQAHCEAWACTAGASECADEKTVQTCSDDGLTITGTTPCSEQEICNDGICVASACVADERTCLNNNVHECEPGRESWTLLTTCIERQTCGAGASGTTECVDWVCEPGQSVCEVDTEELETCADDGLSLQAVDCTATQQICADDACVSPVCADGDTLCENNDVLECAADRLQWTPKTTCGEKESCEQRDSTTAECKAWVCNEPGQPIECEAATDNLTRCADDGLSEETVDCAAAQQICHSNACVTPTCELGKERCHLDAVQECAPNRTGWTHVTSCWSTETCIEDNGAATCVGHVCEPGTTKCEDAQDLVTCSADGVEVLDVVNCSTTGDVCSGSACMPPWCEIGETSCNSNSVYTCGSDLLSWDITPCSATQYCQPGDGGNVAASCVAHECTPSEFSCAGNTRKECNAQGSGYLAVSEECTAGGMKCVGDVCKALDCTASEQLCDGGNAYECTADASAVTLVDTCVNATCVDGGAVATCEPWVCTPDTPACDGNTWTTCAADGLGYVGSRTDCASTEACADDGCHALVFHENFETGRDSFAPTTTGTVAATGANGTANSLQIAGTTTPVYASLPQATTVSYIGFWVRVGAANQNRGYVLLYGPQSTNFFWLYFGTGGTARNMSAGGELASTPYEADRWYHFELKNIDWSWSGSKYDYYVDGKLVASDVPFRARSVGGLSEFKIYNFNAPTEAWWDEFVVW